MLDRDIREALRTRLGQEHASDANTLIVDELAVCQGDARVDVAVVNGSLTGYEIKSERDTLARLGRQQAAYDRVFEYSWLVVGKRHATGVQHAIPRAWGILVATGRADGVDLRVRRPARRNARTESAAVVQLLWREEALAALAARELDRGLRSKSKRHIWAALAEALDPPELGELVRRQLRARVDWPADRRALPS